MPAEADEADDADDEWVEVRRLADPIGADMIRDFLADHDVRVAIRGNPHATRMTWSQTSDVTRIVVPKSDLERAEEVLAAMTSASAHPFRGAAPLGDEPTETAEHYVKPRSSIAAAFLALIVPIGGGHFYARHGAAGTILCAGIIGAVVGAILGGHPELVRTWALLVLIDLVGSILAVRRYNANAIPSDTKQRGWALAALVLAFATTAWQR